MAARRLLLVLLGILAGLALSELGLRAWLHHRATQEARIWQTLDRERARNLVAAEALKDILVPSEHPDVVYELLPGLDTKFLDCRLQTNDRGFRGGPITAKSERPRIVGLGDSHMFGWGVPFEHCYLSVLEREGGFDVINTGVPGYNTAMEVAAFEAKCLDLEPDLVLVEVIGNDQSLPNFLVPDHSYKEWDRSVVLELLRKKPEVGRRLEKAPMKAGGGFVDRPEQVPARYRSMVGSEGMRRAFGRLKNLADKHSFRVLVLYRKGNFQEVPEMLEDLGLPHFEYQHAIIEALRQRGLTFKDYPNSDLVLGPNNAHPSVAGHRVMAEALLERLKREF